MIQGMGERGGGVSPELGRCLKLHHCECVTNRATTKKVNYQDKRLKQKLLPQNDVIMEENILYCLVRLENSIKAGEHIPDSTSIFQFMTSQRMF